MTANYPGASAQTLENTVTQVIDKADAGRFKAQFADIIVVDAEITLQQARHLRRGGKAGVQKLTRANLRFVVSVAKQYQNQGLTAA